MKDYSQIRRTQSPPRLPLKGSLDLTYRCNNNCRHCWVRTGNIDSEKEKELDFDQIRGIADQARKMGCRSWTISGGEPMLRPDFEEVFDFLTRDAAYSLNTNGVLITPAVARLMKRPGAKMIAFYGATEAVHDHITRTPGSFQAMLEGVARLREAGAAFTVQIVPMRDNFHELAEMKALGASLSPYVRIGASWLFMSADRNSRKNAEIIKQRLDAKAFIDVEEPDPFPGFRGAPEDEAGECGAGDPDDLRISRCYINTNQFHIDPYGKMSFCAFIKDPSARYDLLQGTFEEGWDQFIPGLAEKFATNEEYCKNCGFCELRKDCKWCPAFAWLEHGSYTAPIRYLCDIAREVREYRREREHTHCRHYEIGGVTIRVESGLPITDNTFDPRFETFRVDGPGEDTVVIRHYFELPDITGKDLGELKYQHTPWEVYQKNGSWIYKGITTKPEEGHIQRLAVFNRDYSRGRIYNNDIRKQIYEKGNAHSLTLFSTDQIILAPILANRNACIIHSGGVVADEKGFLFVGHSDAGKSTTVSMMKQKNAEILCDDRIITRRWPDGFRIHGTWSHGDVPDVSSNSAPLKALLFLEQSSENRLYPVTERKEIVKRLTTCLVRAHETPEWWDKSFSILTRIADEIPAFRLCFDKSGKAADLILDTFID